MRFLSDFVVNVASSTGVMLDPVYTGKAALGLVKELQNSSDTFKGKRILFLHTGNYNCMTSMPGSRGGDRGSEPPEKSQKCSRVS